MARASTQGGPRAGSQGLFHSPEDYLPIEDYGVIGDLQTVALVGRNGSIDWLSIPDFDSPSVFGALLDVKKGGFFRIAPPDTLGMKRTQMYLPETNILVTRFVSADGLGEVTDFMPIKAQPKQPGLGHHIDRMVHVAHGTMRFEMICRPAFNYGRDAHSVRIINQGAVFDSPRLSLGLAASVDLEEDGQGGVRAAFTLEEGQSAYFELHSGASETVAPGVRSPQEYDADFRATNNYWTDWLAQCRYKGRWREMVQRSALVLKLLTYAPTGAIVAAATTSLPETIGGQRNWDYRFAWLRDAAFTIYSLQILGFVDEARDFMNWVLARCHELEPDGSLLPMYTIHGGHDMTESVLDHWEGYRQSRPVRIGNDAYRQQQLDVYGELLDSIHLYSRHSDISYDAWIYIRRLLGWLGAHWREPDEGIWEVRGGQREFVHSRVMSWVAFDRAIRIARASGFPAPSEEWRATSAAIYEEVMERGWSAERRSFVQFYGSDAIDASALLISLTRFTGSTDPRMLSTIARIRAELTHDSQVYRYDPHLAADDGLGGEEGMFSICSFWLVEALTRAGRLEDARLLLEKMLSYANPVGLYAEEIGVTGEALGNFPQAFTHLALIRACYQLDRALNRAGRRG
jgi:GH15 family glucan-1,4-alpha-glucosidase